MPRLLQPHLLVGPGDVAPAAILTGDPKRVPQLATLLTNPRTVADFRQFITITGTYHQVPVSIASTGIGCPATAITVEELARVGVSTFIRVGTTGALQPEIEIGDLVIATAAARYDGTSRAYAPLEIPAVADYTLLQALVSAARTRRIPHHVGLVWTSDAFYREGEDMVAALRAAHVQSVEMEASVIFLLAQLKGGRGGVVLAVSDNLARGQKKAPVHPAEGPAEHSPPIRRALQRATQVALDAIVHVHRNEHRGMRSPRRQES